MVVRVKLKKSKNPTVVHDVIDCYRHKTDLVIVMAGMCTLVYDISLLEEFDCDGKFI